MISPWIKAIRIYSFAAILPAAIVFLIFADSGRMFAADEQKKAEYVGSAMCLTCHDGYDTAMRGTKHDILFENKEAKGSKNGCEACHGAGGIHIEDSSTGVLRYGEVKPRESSASCLKCHASGNKKDWQISQHALEDVACADCHSPHGKTAKTYKEKKKPEKLLVDRSPALCESCHQQKLAEVSLPSHHPVKEGKVSCSDCHSQHGNSLVEMDRVSDKCVNCHQEKAGPFMYEHAPAAEGCLTCHKPHGSVNQDLLTLKQPALCLQCHTNTPGSPNGHDTAGAFKTCTNCHVDVHGSNKNQNYCASVFGCPYP